MPLLTPETLARAQRANPYYQRRLGWPAHSTHRDSAGVDFAYHVARQQRATQHLWIDGILGPRTWAHMQGRPAWVPPACKSLIINDEEVTVPFGVVNFSQPDGLSFYGQGGFRLRKSAAPNLVVLHWDECPSAHTCFHVLLQRNLAAHLLVDADGMVYQTLDLATAAAFHAKDANERTIGIEIQNPVHPLTFDHGRLAVKQRRNTVTETHPHQDAPWQHLDFTPQQKSRVVELTTFLCEYFHIPKALPNGDIPQRTGLMPPTFSGVCGHYHLQKEKVDPGLSLWPAFEAVFVQPESAPAPPAPTELLAMAPTVEAHSPTPAACHTGSPATPDTETL